MRAIFSCGNRNRLVDDNLRHIILLGFDVLFGRAADGGVETLDNELETRRRAVAVLEFPMTYEWNLDL